MGPDLDFAQERQVDVVEDNVLRLQLVQDPGAERHAHLVTSSACAQARAGWRPPPIHPRLKHPPERTVCAGSGSADG